MELYGICVVVALFLGATTGVTSEATTSYEKSASTLPKDIPVEFLKLAGVLQSKEFNVVYAIGANSTEGFADFAILPGSQPLDFRGLEVEPLFIRVRVLKLNESQIEELKLVIPTEKPEIESTVEKSNLTDTTEDSEEQENPPHSKGFDISATFTDAEGNKLLDIESDSDDIPMPILPIPIPPELVPTRSKPVPPLTPKTPYHSHDDQGPTPAEWGMITMMFYVMMMLGVVILVMYNCFCRTCCLCPDDCEDFDSDSFHAFARAKSSNNGFGKKSKRYSAYERI